MVQTDLGGLGELVGFHQECQEATEALMPGKVRRCPSFASLDGGLDPAEEVRGN